MKRKKMHLLVSVLKNRTLLRPSSSPGLARIACSVLQTVLTVQIVPTVQTAPTLLQRMIGQTLPPRHLLVPCTISPGVCWMCQRC